MCEFTVGELDKPLLSSYAKPANMPRAILEPYFKDLAGKLKNWLKEQNSAVAQEMVQRQ